MVLNRLTWLLALSGIGHWAAAQPSRSIRLDTVAVSGKVQQLTLLPPGEVGGNLRGVPLQPTRRVAVLYQPPTLAHEYDLRSVTLHFSDQYNATSEGRVQVQVQLALPDSSGNPSATGLLANAFELSARQIRRSKNQAVTLSLQGAHLTLPPQGLFVMLTGLPEPGDRFLKDTTVASPRKPFLPLAASKVQRTQTGRYRVVNIVDFINPAIVRTNQLPMSWQFGQHDRQWRRLLINTPNCSKCLVFNYWIDLGVTEL